MSFIPDIQFTPLTGVVFWTALIVIVVGLLFAPSIGAALIWALVIAAVALLVFFAARRLLLRLSGRRGRGGGSRGGGGGGGNA